MLLPIWKEAMEVEKRMPKEPPRAFCYSQLAKISRSFAFFIYQLGDDQLRDAICILYLVLRGLDTIEDDMSITDDIKIPALESFYLRFYEDDWSFPCGSEDSKILMDNFHHVREAFLELNKSYQEVIVDVTKIMGSGMAKYIDEQVETTDEYNEYCYYVSGVVALHLYRFFTVAGVKNLPAAEVAISIGLLFQKMNVIRDYLDDINEMPKPRIYWPRDIWGKYADRLEDFKKEENSTKALCCLNELTTDALVHAKDCLICISHLQDPRVFIPVSVPQIATIGLLALCYNNVEVFRGAVKLRYGLVARIFWETQTISDVYNAFFEFSMMLKDKVNKDDPNADRTLKVVEDLQNFCRESGQLDESRFYIYERKPLQYSSLLAAVLIASLLVSLYCSFNKTRLVDADDTTTLESTQGQEVTLPRKGSLNVMQVVGNQSTRSSYISGAWSRREHKVAHFPASSTYGIRHRSKLVKMERTSTVSSNLAKGLIPRNACLPIFVA